MRVMKRVLITLVFIGLSVSAFYAVKAKYANYTGNASEKHFKNYRMS